MYFPIRAVDPDQAQTNFDRYTALEKKIGEEPQNRFKIKAHLPFPWMWDIIRNKKYLDAIEDIIGPDILCWGSSFFTKNAHDKRFVSWHQDSTYYGLSERATLSVWYAFSPSNIESGCMRFIRHHNKGLYEHDETGDSDNLLMKGQTINGVDEEKAVDVFSIPATPPSTTKRSSTDPIPTTPITLASEYQFTISRRMCTKCYWKMRPHLVRGADRHGHWQEDPEPKEDFDPICSKALDATYGEYLTGAGKY